MTRIISWFSASAASAVATKMINADVIAYCDTGSEDEDNRRFYEDCERWFGRPITRLKNERYRDTWDLWEKRAYLSGVRGAPCTKALKVEPRLAFQQPGDTHVFGYTADGSDIKRAMHLRETYPELHIRFPLIAWGLTKANCLELLHKAGIQPPRVYAMGFPNANCIPCVKATSPNYWALVRKEFPQEFERMVALSRTLSVKLTRIHGERCYIDEIPANWPVTEPLAPECDMLCQAADDLLTAQ